MANDASSNEKQHVNNIPKYTRQRRSPAPRRRTDFSQFIQSSSSCSSSPSNVGLRQGQLMKSVTDDESSSSGIITAFDDSKSPTEGMQKLPLSSSDSENNKQLIICEKTHHSPDKQDSPNSINMHDESPVRRSARSRKISVRFGKETIPSKSTKQARRIKILRQLGLLPPAGSPYARPTMISD
ncbi:unnamed protein product [Rhodiola kirilowii]